MRRAALLAAPGAIGDSVRAVFAASDFVAHACVRDAALLPQLIASGDLLRPLGTAEYAGRAPVLDADISEAQALCELRRWRRRELTRIAWRDLAGWAQLTETLASSPASQLAECLRLADIRVQNRGAPGVLGGAERP